MLRKREFAVAREIHYLESHYKTNGYEIYRRVLGKSFYTTVTYSTFVDEALRTPRKIPVKSRLNRKLGSQQFKIGA